MDELFKDVVLFDIMSIVETWFLVLMALFGSLACRYKKGKING